MISLDKVIDPIELGKILWPHVTFYKEQKEIIYSVRDNKETMVVAAHKMGKDFVTAFIVLWYFLTHHTCRIITTSVKDDHLRVLWGEIGRFIDSAAYPLKERKGGPLIVNHHDIRKITNRATGEVCSISYLRGMVSKTGEGMAGHHADYSLFVGDEASGLADEAYRRASSWMKRALIIGNPYPANMNFFERLVKEGDKKYGEKKDTDKSFNDFKDTIV